MSNCRHGVNSKYCKVCTNNTDGLTKEQITTWRRHISFEIGLAAFALPVSTIVKYRDNVQAAIDKIIAEQEC